MSAGFQVELGFFARTRPKNRYNNFGWTLGGPIKRDKMFFFFGEETDWCRRFLAHGWKLRFAPVGEITHHGGGSSGALNTLAGSSSPLPAKMV